MPIDETTGTRRCPAAASPRVASSVARLALATLLLGAISCGDATTAPRSVSIRLWINTTNGPVISTTQDSLPLIDCTWGLGATATGTDTATWSDGKIRWYAGVDRLTPFDSAALSASEIQQYWGNTRIQPGQTQGSQWELAVTAPFHADLELHYKPDHGDIKTADVGLDCGPIVPSGTPAPTIDTVFVQLAPGAIQPGDTLTVGYAVSSPVGILQTAVVLSGPCVVQQLVAERLQTKVTGSVRVRIPATCQLGVPLTVTVFARDAGLQTASQGLDTQVALVDATPPQLSGAFTNEARVPPVVFTGDSIGVQLSASDNHALAAVVWDLIPDSVGAEVVDSQAISGSSVNGNLFIHLPAGLLGPARLRLYARDAVGLVSDTLTSTWQVYPTVDLPAASATVSGAVMDAIPDPKRQVAYLRQADRILVLSLSTMTVTHTIALPKGPSDFDITPGGDSLVVAMPDTDALGIVDLRQPSPAVSLLPLASVDSGIPPIAVSVKALSNGKLFVWLYAGTVLDEIDLTTGTQRARQHYGGSEIIGPMIWRSLDHSVILEGPDNDLDRYDVATDQFGPVAGLPGNPALDSTGRRVAAGVNIYDASLQLIRQAVPAGPNSLLSALLSPDGNTLYEVSTDGTIARARVSDGAIVDRIMNPNTDLHGFAHLSDDGTLLMTTQGPGQVRISRVSVIHLH